MKLNFFKTVIHTGENKEYLFPTLRICRILSGEFDWKIGKNILHVKSGDIVLLNNLAPRKIINAKTSRSEIEVFEFSPTYILNRKLLPEMFYGENPVIASSKNQKLIGRLLSVISESFGTIQSHNLFDHILQAVFDLLENDSHRIESGRKHSAKVFEAIEFIWAHYHEDISVPDVAKHLNISKNHLEKLFKDTQCIGVGAYIRIIRIYKVISLLEENNERSVLDIAFSCGFNSSSGFYKAYKAVTGQTPRRNNDGS